MPASMKSTMKVEVAGNGTSSATQTIQVEAYGQIFVTVPAATGSVPVAGTVDVAVHGGGAGQLQLLFITASAYSSDLSYITGDVSPPKSVILDSPQLFVGGAISLLGTVNSIEFSNAGAADVDVEILVGRDATP